MSSIEHNRLSGKVCRTLKGHEIIWNGHLCEGANLTPPRNDNFCLWTVCGKHDVPANAAQTGNLADVECKECRKILDDEIPPLAREEAYGDYYYKW